MLLSFVCLVPVWSLLNRFVYNGLYYFCTPLFIYDNHKIEKITGNIVSGFHTLKCLQHVFQESYIRDIHFTYHSDVNYNSIVFFSVSYFIYDLLNDMRIKNTSFTFILHHSMSILTGVYLYNVNLSQIYLVALFVELSNINLNIKETMDILELKHLRFYIINGILFSLTFFLSRILYGPIALRSSYLLTNEVNKYHELHNLPLILTGSFITLNLFWFQKIVRIIIYKYRNYNNK